MRHTAKITNTNTIARSIAPPTLAPYIVLREIPSSLLSPNTVGDGKVLPITRRKHFRERKVMTIVYIL